MPSPSRGFRSSDCLAAVAAAEADVGRLAEGLTDAQFHAPSRKGGWSVGFCLEHLILAGQAFFPKWDAALQDRAGKPLSERERYYPYTWCESAFLRILEPPSNIRTKTAQFAKPAVRRPMDETIRRVSAMHREFVRRIELSAATNPARTRVQSPFASWLWYPLGFSFDLALAHERRQLWEAWQVRFQFVGARAGTTKLLAK